MTKQGYTKVLKKAQKQETDVQLANMKEINRAVKALIKSNPPLKEWSSLMNGIVLSSETLWHIMNYNNCPLYK